MARGCIEAVKGYSLQIWLVKAVHRKVYYSYLRTSIQGVLVFFIVSLLNSSGSLSLIRKYSRLRGGIAPRPRQTRQAVPRWSSVVMSTKIIETRAETTKPISIWTFVNSTNHRFRVPSLSSPVLSAHATLPAGYSPLSHVSTCCGKKFFVLLLPKTLESSKESFEEEDTFTGPQYSSTEHRMTFS